MEKEAATLIRAGWDVTVVLPNNVNETINGIKIVGITRPAGRLKRATLSALKVALKGLRENGDVYHFHDPELLPIGLLLRVLGKRVVYDVHETHSASISHRPYVPRLLRKPLGTAFSLIERAISKYLSGIVAATPAISEQFRKITTPRVTVQNFPQLDAMSQQPAQSAANRQPLAVYMGAMSEGRGVLTMIRAVGIMQPSIGARLALAGHIATGLLEKARAEEGFDRVIVAGVLTRPQLRELLSQARVGLVLFHPEPNNINAFPTKMFEYMEAALPVLASDFPLWRSIVQGNECGLVVDPLDVAKIASALEYLMTHESEARKMGERGRKLVRSKYNWSHEGEKLVSFYRRFTHN